MAEGTVGTLDSGVSSIAGFSEAGDIHGRLLRADPGSATAVVGSLADEVVWFGQMFTTLRTMVHEQDLMNVIGLDAVAGQVSAVAENLPFAVEPESGVRPVHFHKPIVQVDGSDFLAVAGQVSAIDIGQMTASVDSWSDLSQAARAAASELEAIIGQVQAENEGEAVTAGVNRIEQTVAAARVFATNAESMAGRTAAFAGLTINASIFAAMDASVISQIEDPAERKLAEKAAAARVQRNLQQAVDASLPSGGELISEFGLGAGGQDVEVGLNGHAGYTQGLDIEEVTWPEALVEAAAQGELGPGSFEVADGQIRPVAGVGMPPEQQGLFDRAVQASREPTVV
ncbi:hypothetical protein CPHO_09360 [Corynebacterium phocae]|uniref:Uncharacterized protein n=1 Tax=Corynebacterium phocae TaxID=161895 RepID=A0A1L7D4S3_9CORY|nr:hypothetical protein CPHO_09360 [Corynebacterium phocae]